MSRGSKKVVKCFYCHGEGHMKNDYLKGNKKQDDGDCTDFIDRDVVSTDVLVVNTTKHSDYMHVHRIPGT